MLIRGSWLHTLTLLLVAGYTGSANAQEVYTLDSAEELPAGEFFTMDGKKIDVDAKANTDGARAVECPACANPWANVPPTRILPRPGNFPIPPTGSGFYSAYDYIRNIYHEKRPTYGYPFFAAMINPIFDGNWRYLEDPKNASHDWLDPIHRIHIGDNWLLNTGGEFRWRHMNEVNSRLSGRNNNYDLFRTRVYGDLWYRDAFRVFVEYLDAQSFNQNLRPLPIDIDRSDLLNLFVDVKLGEIKEKPVYLRVGRQELLLGSQRLLSPLDWANTRRTFQGIRAFRQGEKFDVDLFWMQPVIPDPSNLDSVDNDQNFAGLWTTYRAKQGQFFDLYWLFRDNTSPFPLLGQPAAVPFNVHTLGMRSCGKSDQLVWDLETMFHMGERGPQTTVAAACSVGGGYQFKNAPLNPTFWVYYDWASGDQNPDAVGGTYNTFNQLFPFGHYYLGWTDLVGRQNIHDVNCHLFLYPTNWITVWAQFHHYELASTRDALYNAGGVPLRRDPTGNSGREVGNEVDIIVNFHLTNHQDILVGFSQLFAGDFIKNTALTPGAGRSAENFYLLYNVRW